MIKKIFLALVALFFIFIGGVWMLARYVQSNPDSVFQFADHLMARFTAGEPYEEKAEENLHNIQHVTVRTENANIDLQPTDSEILSIFYAGKVPKMESGPFIEKVSGGVKVEFRLHEPMSSAFFSMNVNGENISRTSDVALKAIVSVPKSYKGLLTIETNRGQVDMAVAANTIYEFDLSSNKGIVENTVVQDIPDQVNPQDIGRIQIFTQTGDILVHNQ